MKYRTKPGVIMTQICGKNFLVTPEETIQINDSAALYWERLREGAAEADLYAAAHEHYDVEDPALLQADIAALLESLLCRHLLVRYKA